MSRCNNKKNVLKPLPIPYIIKQNKHLKKCNYDWNETHKFLLSQLIPFIRFDIINIDYFANAIEPIITKYNLLSTAQLYNIYMSWHKENLLREKFTLTRQRFDYQTNYLDLKNDIINEGDFVRAIPFAQDKQCQLWCLSIQEIDKKNETIKFRCFAKPLSWKDLVVLKSSALPDIHNGKAKLTMGNDIRTGNVYKVRHYALRNDSQAWCFGKICDTRGYNYRSLVKVHVDFFDKCNSHLYPKYRNLIDRHCTWWVCVDDDSVFQYR